MSNENLEKKSLLHKLYGGLPMNLPDDPVFTEAAVVKTEEGAFADISLAGAGDDSRVMIRATSYGSMDFSVRDGDTEYRYTPTVYEDQSGHTQILITER
ncbi:MAG: hypothetical protein II831_02990 [Firmicutes bacterium]|nr:hypothetical protein [Bacillota bacterium]